MLIVAEMSSRTTSSAPARPCLKANSADPGIAKAGKIARLHNASRSTSRQAIMRLVSIGSSVLKFTKIPQELEAPPFLIFRDETALQRAVRALWLLKKFRRRRSPDRGLNQRRPIGVG